MEINGNTLKITLPTGNWAIIREQNGEDDDVLSNVSGQDMSNFSEFISRIVIDSSYGKLTVEKAKNLPSNDRFAIIIGSRIHSIGNEVEFDYTWPNKETIHYSQDLNELLFDYGSTPTMEELESKPYAVPYYPNSDETIIITKLPSGKEVKYEIMSGAGEAYILKLPLERRTKNCDLIARNLQLVVDGKWEKVQNFALFTKRDMIALRKHVAENDPVFLGFIDIENPNTGETAVFSILGSPDFFYPGGL